MGSYIVIMTTLAYVAVVIIYSSITLLEREGERERETKVKARQLSNGTYIILY